MAQSVNRTIKLPVLADLQIYVDKRDQQKAQRLLDRQPEILRRAYNNAAMEFANKLLRVVKTCLNKGQPPAGQGVSWPPHSPHTTKKYGEHTLLHLTGQYARTVQIMRNRNGNIIVGIPPNVKKERPTSKSQEGQSDGNSIRTLNQVAYILEVGTANIPPRPLWKPAYQSVGGTKEVKKLMVKHIRKEIRKEFGGIRHAKL